MPALIQPQTGGRHGTKPQLIRLPSFRREIEYVCNQAQQLHQAGTAWSEMAIVYRSYSQGQQICQQLETIGIPTEWINRNRHSRHYDPLHPSLKLVTMHSSKGLEFPVVFIPGIGSMPAANLSQEDEARLLYVAMTRSIERLVLTCDRNSAFVMRLETALGKVGAKEGQLPACQPSIGVMATTRVKKGHLPKFWHHDSFC